MAIGQGYDVFNIARGRVRTYLELPAANDALVAVLFKAAGQSTEDALVDFTTLAAIKGSNVEADFTNYGRRPIQSGVTTPGQASIVPDNTANILRIGAPNVEWVPAGGATNNDLGRLVWCYQPDLAVVNDTLVVPLFYGPFVTSTDGTIRQARIPTTGLWASRSPV